MYKLFGMATQNRSGGRRWPSPGTILTGGVLALALLLAACTSEAPTSTPLPAPTATPEPAPTATSVPEPVITPTVTVQDQELVDGTVTVQQVVSDGPGWLVIHADSNGAPGPVLGFAPVQEGENADVVVELAEEGRTETLYAMLHTDAGAVGTYEFPGDDVPVTVDGQVVTPAFQVSGGMSMITPSVTVQDQELVDGTVTVQQVVSDGPGWLVIHADSDGAPGPVLGFAPVQEGENADVVVELAEEGRTETLYAMLHTDAGVVGTYEFPGDDVPVTVDGQVVTPAFQVSGGMSMITPSVTVQDQELVDGTVTVQQVVSDGPGWLVIHADSDGAPGPVLGFTPVQEGENADVVVELDLTGVTGTLYAMLHTDAGAVGTYEFPGDDVPATLDDEIVLPPFKLEAAEGEVTVKMVNMSFDPAVVVIRASTTVTWVNEDGNIGHTSTSDDGLWDSGLFSGGDSFSFSFEQPGVYAYYCQPHGGPAGQGMSGTIIVIS